MVLLEGGFLNSSSEKPPSIVDTSLKSWSHDRLKDYLKKTTGKPDAIKFTFKIHFLLHSSTQFFQKILIIFFSISDI